MQNIAHTKSRNGSLPWSYAVHGFAYCKTFNELVFAKLGQYSGQVLLKSCKKPAPQPFTKTISKHYHSNV